MEVGANHPGVSDSAGDQDFAHVNVFCTEWTGIAGGTATGSHTGSVLQCLLLSLHTVASVPMPNESTGLSEVLDSRWEAWIPDCLAATNDEDTEQDGDRF